jgi:hypothetical protein
MNKDQSARSIGEWLIRKADEYETYKIKDQKK